MRFKMGTHDEPTLEQAEIAIAQAEHFVLLPGATASMEHLPTGSVAAYRGAAPGHAIPREVTSSILTLQLGRSSDLDWDSAQDLLEDMAVAPLGHYEHELIGHHPGWAPLSYFDEDAVAYLRDSLFRVANHWNDLLVCTDELANLHVLIHAGAGQVGDAVAHTLGGMGKVDLKDEATRHLLALAADYAALNRHRITKAVLEVLGDGVVDFGGTRHTGVALEQHFGEEFTVVRKHAAYVHEAGLVSVVLGEGLVYQTRSAASGKNGITTVEGDDGRVLDVFTAPINEMLLHSTLAGRVDNPLACLEALEDAVTPHSTLTTRVSVWN